MREGACRVMLFREYHYMNPVYRAPPSWYRIAGFAILEREDLYVA